MKYAILLLNTGGYEVRSTHWVLLKQLTQKRYGKPSDGAQAGWYECLFYRSEDIQLLVEETKHNEPNFDYGDQPVTYEVKKIPVTPTGVLISPGLVKTCMVAIFPNTQTDILNNNASFTLRPRGVLSESKAFEIELEAAAYIESIKVQKQQVLA